MKNQNRPLILAHRGYWEIAPENTKLAFDAAALFGFDGLEIDLHQTKDNHLVVIHDETLKRTSDSHGRVIDHTLKELKEMNFTAKFNHHFPKQVILTYEEFLKEYGHKFKVINVEIKTDVIHYAGIEKKALEIHKKIKPKAKIIYSSFNFESCKILRKLDKKVLIGFLCVDSNDIKEIRKEVIETCNFLNPWFKSMKDPKEVSYYKRLKLDLIIWTLDRRVMGDEWSDHSWKTKDKLLKMKNVYGIISNSKI